MSRACCLSRERKPHMMGDKKLEYRDAAGSQISVQPGAGSGSESEKMAAYVLTDPYGTNLTADQCDEVADFLRALSAKSRDDGTLTFSFKMSPEIHAKLRSQLGLRKMCGETWGLSDAFVARILTCFEEGISSWNFDDTRPARKG